MLTETLNKCIKDNILTCLTLDLNDWETIIIGRIKSFDEKHIYLDEVNPYGVFIRLNRRLLISKVCLISFDDIYGNDLSFLAKSSDIKLAKPKYKYLKSAENSYEDYFAGLIKANKIFSFFVDDDYIMGVVTDQDDKYLKVNNFTYQGLIDGFTLIEKRIITKLRYDGPVECKVDLLRKWKGENR